MDGFINCGFVVALHCHLETEHFIVSHKEKKKKMAALQSQSALSSGIIRCPSNLKDSKRSLVLFLSKNRALCVDFPGSTSRHTLHKRSKDEGDFLMLLSLAIN